MIYSSGIICYKTVGKNLSIFMCHSTGPFPYWSFPKGHIEDGEDSLTAAIREFKEETSFEPYNWCELDEVYETKPYIYLGEIQQRKDKMVSAYAVLNSSIDPDKCYCNEIEFPANSGIIIPEIDQYRWVSIEEAYKIINPTQIPLLDNLIKYI